MTKFVQIMLLVSTLLWTALSVGSCDKNAGQDTVAAQDYSASLTSLGTGTGELQGRILFPHEYTQRSAVFTLNGNTFVTLPDGRFRVKGIPVGDVQLVVTEEGYDALTLVARVQPSVATDLGAQRLIMARGRVLGRMVDEKGRSAAGIEVRLAPSGKMALTDKDGIFQFMAVPKGKHTLSVNDKVFFMANQRMELERDESRNLGNIQIFRQQTSQAREVGQRTTP